MKLPKLAMKGIFSNASRTFHARGDVNTGFAPWTSSTCTGDWPADRMPAASLSIDATPDDATPDDPPRPSIDERARAAGGPGRPQLLLENDVCETECQHALRARRHRHPLVGIRAGLRHARFNLHERAADARAPLPHPPVRDALRHRRIPRPEKIGAEAQHVSRARQIERRQLLAAEAQQVGPAQHLVSEQLEPERRRRSE